MNTHRIQCALNQPNCALLAYNVTWFKCPITYYYVRSCGTASTQEDASATIKMMVLRGTEIVTSRDRQKITSGKSFQVIWGIFPPGFTQLASSESHLSTPDR